ncbi:MAG: hypothetical protein A2X77_05325 [Gammaproteobacteria bacterium GWE2_42_36]|nr:MAG: hypothetical protein A2X77_05325 [Gammaproteobacteria bacterium GWE2_42_36]HCU04816.1 Asp-tRNA(Asn)/Glu-tRNA(Gln) amidotransferase GatCAB subunit C [Coxiellaceae bacterium]
MTPDEIKKLARLARLRITDEETEKYSDINEILQLVKQIMEEKDTSAIEPLCHPLDIEQRIRPDIVTESNERDYLQKNAPLATHGIYLVPQVIPPNDKNE